MWGRDGVGGSINIPPVNRRGRLCVFLGDGTRKEGILPAELVVVADRAEPPGRLERLYLEHQGRVFRAAYRVTGSLADAEDVLQTVFLRLARSEPWQQQDIGNIPSYLYRSAVNAALDLLRARRAVVPLDEAEAVASRDSRPDALRLRLALRAALAQLSPRWAEIFALRHFEGYANEEIARMLGLSRAAVGVTLFRARRRLQRHLQEQRRSER